ncbi:MAG: hypothetical protein IPM98_08995 [Lewinellaceae bacterium]|nr:hypothetical protein [Lewinellaceae bacterium]
MTAKFAGLFALLLCGIAAQAQAPDVRRPANGGGVLLGTSVSIVDHQDFRATVGPVAGFYYFEDLSDRWTFQVEFHWKIVSGYRLHAGFADTLVLPSGISTSQALFDVRSLVFWELPVLLQWRPHREARHAWLAGVRPSLNQRSGGQSSWSSASTGGVDTDLSRLNIRQGWRGYDVGLLLGWQYALSERMSLDVRYNQGLFDLTADNFFKNKTNTLNSDLQLTLRARF